MKNEIALTPAMRWASYAWQGFVPKWKAARARVRKARPRSAVHAEAMTALLFGVGLR